MAMVVETKAIDGESGRGVTGIYRKICEDIGVPPVGYAVACAVGILGGIGTLLLVNTWDSRWAMIPFQPLLMAPFLAAMFWVKGTNTQKFEKCLIACFVSMFLSFVPGVLMGEAIAKWLLR